MAVGWTLERLEMREEAEALGLLIRETEGSVLAFALFHATEDREAAVHALNELLALPVVEFTLSQQKQNPVELFRTVPNHERHCVFFHDIEAALPDVAGYLNLQREAFSDAPHAAVFWVGEHGLRQLAELAPDFYAWRSGVFDFRVERPGPSTGAMQAAIAQDSAFMRNPGDLQRRISLYEGLIREYEQQEEPDPRFLVELHRKLGEALYLSHRPQQAAPHARTALELSRAVGTSDTEAGCLHLLGILAQEQRQWAQAEDHYHKALQIGLELDDRRNQGSTYHQLGVLAQEQRQWAQAEDYYHKALQIKIEFDDRCSQASTYHQLGRVAQEQRQWAQAEDYYHKALQIFVQFDDRYRQAHTYHELGIVAQGQRQWAQAEDYYHKALQAFVEFDDRYEQAGTYHQLGRVAEEQRQWAPALEHYQKALATYVEFKDEHKVGIVLGSLARLWRETDDDGILATVAEALGETPENVKARFVEALGD